MLQRSCREQSRPCKKVLAGTDNPVFKVGYEPVREREEYLRERQAQHLARYLNNLDNRTINVCEKYGIAW